MKKNAMLASVVLVHHNWHRATGCGGAWGKAVAGRSGPCVGSLAGGARAGGGQRVRATATTPTATVRHRLSFAATAARRSATAAGRSAAAVGRSTTTAMWFTIETVGTKLHGTFSAHPATFVIPAEWSIAGPALKASRPEFTDLTTKTVRLGHGCRCGAELGEAPH